MLNTISWRAQSAMGCRGGRAVGPQTQNKEREGCLQPPRALKEEIILMGEQI